MMRDVLVYTDYKSPYAYLAKDDTYALAEAFDVRLVWRPYTLDIPSYLGSVEDRNANQWRKVRYAYKDARRYANKRGLTLKGPKAIYDSSVAMIGMLYAIDAGEAVFRAYHDDLFERFWSHEIEIESRAEIEAALGAAGADAAGFAAFVDGEGRARHDALRAEAEEMGIFGVPTLVLEGELFWGQDRIGLVRERLAEPA